MASSPTSSSYSAYSTPFSSSWKFPDLPVAALRNKIVEKIQENRVTLIVGETGCGKSSQVPQFLLEENMEPILCTQPRRFAVVAVARMVAKSRNCEIGGEVGYHIGHSRVVSARSKIVFKTAGVLLEELREKGLNALKYKAIILDEVHERSVESDLVLVCVKQFLMKNNDLRVVLMSATADIARYRDYFKDLGRGERVEVLGIPSTSQNTLYQRKVLYLEQVTELLGISSENLSLKYCSGPTPSIAGADIKPEVHKLVHNLVLHIHNTEPDIEKSILIFLPTYQSLEQQWSLLKPFSSCFKVHILHSSIDTEKALMAMKIWRSHRKVILATNIAESSVTIPKVAFVIDSCRSLQVFWDSNRKMDSAELTWVSRSQAEQRKGRTGRTCDGQIYRLVEGSFFNQLQEFERPAIMGLSLRQQVLLICCAESKPINDPKDVMNLLQLKPAFIVAGYGNSWNFLLLFLGYCIVLLQKALDSPDPEVVEDALSLLVHIHALEKTSPRGRYEPTFYGRLLSNFSLSFEASMLILKFGGMGMLREGILLGVLMDTQPLPILRPFGQDILFGKYTDNYYSGDNKNTVLNGRKEVVFMANLCAFQFWQRIYKDKLRLKRLKQHLNFDETKVSEEEWCSFHNLVQPSLHHVAEICMALTISFFICDLDKYVSYGDSVADEEVLNSIHRFRPQFLSESDGLPSYYEPYEFQHTCLLTCQQDGDTDELATDNEDLELSEITKCISAPFVPSNYFKSCEVAERFAIVIKEIRVQDTKDISGDESKYASGDGPYVPGQASLCKYFVKGLCNRGNQCLFSHSLQSHRPVCKFFQSLKASSECATSLSSLGECIDVESKVQQVSLWGGTNLRWSLDMVLGFMMKVDDLMFVRAIGCKNGDDCFFSHDLDQSTSSFHRPSLCLPEDGHVDAALLLRLFPTSSHGCILLLDDTGLHFSLHVANHYDPSRMISTTSLPEDSILEPSLADVRILWGLSHPSQTTLSRAADNPIPWNDVKCVLWFPNFDSNSENWEEQKSVVRSFFECLAIRIMEDALLEVQVILTMNNIRFSQLQVEKLGRESFFFLGESFPFDESSFGKLSDKVNIKKPMVVSKPISYVFYMNPPPNVPSDDYTAAFYPSDDYTAAFYQLAL
ncbi:hypothetical protein RHSIM_Rhsim01G0284800 [Rhododendron simsii]|uniref:RNA helicase n=1 Tax=Rhododendron simsii TaxID=118357 RepID=A0A834M184_RHOSS|nr:hypothetical protein RHSIM_Rhsim01G0284800 [Rhododendron simsii]